MLLCDLANKTLESLCSSTWLNISNGKKNTYSATFRKDLHMLVSKLQQTVCSNISWYYPGKLGFFALLPAGFFCRILGFGYIDLPGFRANFHAKHRSFYCITLKNFCFRNKVPMEKLR